MSKTVTFYSELPAPAITLRVKDAKGKETKSHRVRFQNHKYTALSAENSELGVNEWELMERSDSNGNIINPYRDVLFFSEKEMAERTKNKLTNSEVEAVESISKIKDAEIAKKDAELNEKDIKLNEKDALIAKLKASLENKKPTASEKPASNKSVGRPRKIK